jgi:RNA polymerase sigma factor for flagellar operon FliA
VAHGTPKQIEIQARERRAVATQSALHVGQMSGRSENLSRRSPGVLREGGGFSAASKLRKREAHGRTGREEERERRNREDRILKLLPLVKRMAMQMRERLPLHVELDDLVGAGVLGLVDAVRKFDSRKDVKLESYARHRIRGAMLDGLRCVDSASRDMRKKEKSAERVYRSLEAKLGRAPDNAEIAEALGLTLAKWHRMVGELRAVGFDWLRPIDSVGAKDPCEPTGESLAADGRHTQFDLCYHRERRDLLGQALRRLPDRDQEIVQLYYHHDLTMRQIGGRLGIDESRVSQLHAAALARLRLRINEMVTYPHPGPPRPSW